MDDILVRKLNLQREETWRYSGRLLERGDTYVLIEANFNRDDTMVHGVMFRRGDPFVEIYYSDRWYNVFEVHDAEDGRIKCWYCNVTLPAEWLGGEIVYVDLALDLFVYPDGHQLVLDEDEFEALNPPAPVRAQALAALEHLKLLVRPQDGYHLR
jgi:protein associated with RNAse G/E